MTTTTGGRICIRCGRPVTPLTEHVFRVAFGREVFALGPGWAVRAVRAACEKEIACVDAEAAKLAAAGMDRVPVFLDELAGVLRDLRDGLDTYLALRAVARG